MRAGSEANRGSPRSGHHRSTAGAGVCIRRSRLILAQRTAAVPGNGVPSCPEEVGAREVVMSLRFRPCWVSCWSAVRRAETSTAPAAQGRLGRRPFASPCLARPVGHASIPARRASARSWRPAANAPLRRGARVMPRWSRRGRDEPVTQLSDAPALRPRIRHSRPAAHAVVSGAGTEGALECGAGGHERDECVTSSRRSPSTSACDVTWTRASHRKAFA